MELISVVKDFLEEQNTDFALFITGEWGSGKTYFLKHDLFEAIKTTTINDNNKIKKKKRSFEPVYISLYGISEVIEVEKRIFFEINPILKSKPAHVLNFIGKRYSGWFNRDDIKNIFSVFDIPKYKVLCFDDLERVDKEILDQSLGYINQLVEHQNLKVIFIGDQTNLRKKVPEFDDIKEKTIRFTYKFSPDIRKSYDSFIDNYPDSYRSFLIENKDFICEIFDRGNHCNLRTLKFSLDLFKKVYCFVEIDSANEKFKGQVLDRLLFFSTVYSIEYKKSDNISNLAEIKQINSDNILFSELPNLQNFLIDNAITVNEPASSEPSYLDSFKKSYLPFDDHFFNYFEVIADFVSTGFLEIGKIRSDIKDIISDISQKELSKETMIMNRLSGFLTLKDDELAPLIKEILDKVEIGKFELSAYPNLFRILLQIEFYKINNFKITKKTIEIFKRGIEICKVRAKHVESFRFKIPIGNKQDPRYELISDFAIKANDSLLDKELEINAAGIIPLIEANRGQELYDYIIRPENKGQPFFSYLDPILVFEKVKVAENDLIYYFTSAIYDRYINGYVGHSFNKENKFFMDLLALVITFLKKEKGNKISNKLMSILSEKLTFIVKDPDSL